ncbi:hypothetical protein [Xanthomonas arboricola]|uniref:hypothetical protein n=1 Tax=Xanthomonas arboricola TaxID=56448 RepID=UPI0011B0E553|nr:hypothetical protein [Xanthomonas arboricola]
MARSGQLSFLGRVFASAIARRVAYALVAIVLAWCGIGRAHAKDYANQGQAYQGCLADSAAATGRLGGKGAPNCALETPGLYKCYAYQAFNGGNSLTLCGASPPAETNHRYALSCKEKPDYNGAFPGSLSGIPVSGSYQCNSGCVQTWTPNSDGSWNGTFLADQACNPDNNNCGGGFHYNANLGMCEPDPPAECPKGQIKKANGQCTPNQCPEGMTLQQDGTCGPANNECPSGQVKSPAGGCLPGDGQCAAGEVRGPDGTCKKDGNGDGDPDEPGEGDKSQFSGGDDCSSPPSCSGDAIMCGQARIQWRIDCNTRKNRNVSGGTCSMPPICTGEKCDAVEYSSMMFQWRSACAAEKLLAQGNGNGGSEGEQPSWTKVAGMSQDPGAGAAAGDTKITTNKINADDLDQSGFGGGQCVGFASGGGGAGVSSGFTQTMASPPAIWCNYISAVKGIFVLIGSVASVIILAKMGNS